MDPSVLLLTLVYFLCASANPISHPCTSVCDNCSSNTDTGIELKCGSDGVTYLNECELHCHKVHCNSTLSVLHDGLCIYPPEEIHEDGFISQSNTNNSVTNTNTESISNSAALCDPFQNCTCNYELLLTCGNDGTTYANECVLNCAKKCNKYLQIRHFGSCY